MTDTALMLAFFASAAFGVGSLLYAIVASGRRKRHFLRGLCGLVAAFAVLVMNSAVTSGRDPAEVAAARVEREAAKAQAELADAEAKQAEKAAAAGVALAKARSEAAEAAACSASASCSADAVFVQASSRCAEAVERLGNYSSRWTDGMLGVKFPRVGWADQAAGTLNFAGDAIEFQNGFGAWQPHVYICTFDPKALEVITVAAEPGRL